MKKHIKPCNCETCKNFLQEALVEERKKFVHKMDMILTGFDCDNRPSVELFEMFMKLADKISKTLLK